jgi:hypothetical protein
MHAVFCFENMKGKDHSEDLGVDGKMDLWETGWEGVGWMHLAHDRVRWRLL